MATPDFILDLRTKIGHDPLLLPGVTVIVLRPTPSEAHTSPNDDLLVAATLDSRSSAPGDLASTSSHAKNGTHDFEVLMVRRSDNGRWTPITGIVDPGEHPHCAAMREAREETQVDIEIQSLLGVQAVGPITYPNGDVANYVDTAFRASLAENSPAAGVGDDENTEVRWFHVKHLPETQPRFAHTIKRAVQDAIEPVKATWGPMGDVADIEAGSDCENGAAGSGEGSSATTTPGKGHSPR